MNKPPKPPYLFLRPATVYLCSKFFFCSCWFSSLYCGGFRKGDGNGDFRFKWTIHLFASAAMCIWSTKLFALNSWIVEQEKNVKVGDWNLIAGNVVAKRNQKRIVSDQSSLKQWSDKRVTQHRATHRTRILGKTAAIKGGFNFENCRPLFTREQLAAVNLDSQYWGRKSHDRCVFWF